MKPGIIHSIMKLKRAKQHLDELIVEVERFAGERPTPVLEYADPMRGLYVERFEARPTPNSVNFLPGEFVYCVRSSLDHLAWNLSLLTTNTPASNTQFPIQAEFTKRSQQRFASQTQDIPLAAVKIIKSLQPYQRRTAFQSNPLWQLDKLCNADKHRFIIFSYLGGSVTNLDDSVPARFREIDNGFEVAVRLADKDKLKLQHSPLTAIFGDPIGTSNPIEIGIDGLRRIYEYVRHRVIPQFEGFF
jgi:hypothetical protein